MKRLLAAVVVAVLLLCFSGCQRGIIGRTEIDEIIFIRILGFDKGNIEGRGQIHWDNGSDKEDGDAKEDDDGVTVTVSAKKGQEGGGGSSGSKQESLANNITSSGKTVFEALRNFTTFVNKKPFYGHVDFFIFGEDAGRDDISKYTDFINRDYEPRLNSNVYMVKGDTAHNLITNIGTEDIYISDYLKNLEKSISGTSTSKSTSLLEFVNMLDKEYSAPYIPCIEMIEETGKEAQGGKKQDSAGDGAAQKFLKLSGYGIFKNRRLIGYLSGRESRGVNLVRGFVRSGIVVVQDKKGDKLSLEIIGTNAAIKPNLKENMPSVLIKVTVDSNVGEYQGREDITPNEFIDSLKKQQEQIVKSEIIDVVKYAQKNNADFLGIGDAVHHKYPAQWEDNYEKKWDEIFPQMEIDVEVLSNISRTYIIREPAGVYKKK